MYFVTVRAWDDAGMFTSVSSDGIIVDLTGPDPSGAVVEEVTFNSTGGVVVDVEWQRYSDIVYVQWRGFHDEESVFLGLVPITVGRFHFAQVEARACSWTGKTPSIHADEADDFGWNSSSRT